MLCHDKKRGSQHAVKGFEGDRLLAVRKITAFKNAQRFRAKIQKARDRGIGIDRIIPVYKCHQKDHGLHLGKRVIQFVGEDITL
ncbi:MAG: hypothetical protein IIZ49_01410, partial [Oscillospiraceae bacterium]|nr:hypothetical protein [Oscillospiraceae bacterium]